MKSQGAATLLIFYAGAMLISGCGAPNASLLTHPKRNFAFPLYVTIPGTSPGTGSIQKVADSDTDSESELEEILTGLNFPSAITVQTNGTIYFIERTTPTSSRLMRLASGATEAEELTTDLTASEGLTIDRASRIYVSERSLNRVSMYKSDGTFEVINEEFSSPTALAADDADNLIVTEAGRVSRLIPDGTREEILTEEGVVQAGTGLVGNTFVLQNTSGLGDGKATIIDDSGATSTFLDYLMNPRSAAWEDGTIIYVAEGVPVNRIIKYSTVASTKTRLVKLPGDPHSLAFTPLD